MKRDALPSPAEPATAAPLSRTTPGQLNTARAALALREYSIADLSELIEASHPDRPLDMTRLVERLHQLRHIELVGDKLGLTKEGARVAASHGARQLWHRPPEPPPNGEAERRSLLLAGTGTSAATLTRGLRRAAASVADLADPPMRPGAQACLELPSRIGDKLHYRSGRITTMDGAELEPARRLTPYRPTRDGHSNAAVRVEFNAHLFSR